jgi:hypothetical protein
MNDGFNAGPYPDFDQHDADMVAQINNCGGGGGGCLPLGSPCTLNNDCCSNKCKGPAGGKTCK